MSRCSVVSFVVFTVLSFFSYRLKVKTVTNSVGASSVSSVYCPISINNGPVSFFAVYLCLFVILFCYGLSVIRLNDLGTRWCRSFVYVYSLFVTLLVNPIRETLFLNPLGQFVLRVYRLSLPPFHPYMHWCSFVFAV